MNATAARSVPPLGTRASTTASLRRIRQRVHEPSFWRVQLTVLGVSGVHALSEALSLADGSVHGTLLEISVILYLLPVVDAGLHYGTEGGVLTAVWAALLAVPNLLLWHGDGYEWLGELVVLAFVVAGGAVISVPVERERRARAEAIAVSDRLALTNEIAELLLRPVGLDERLAQVTRRLMDSLDLAGVAIVDGGRDRQPVVHAASVARRPGSAVSSRDDWSITPAGHGVDDVVIPVPLGHGWRRQLVARPRPETTIEPSDHELLSAVAVPLALAMDNARLHAAETEQLAHYGHEITIAQERERSRIARDLHDVATHELLLACREIDLLAERPETVVRDLSRLRERMASVVDYLRQFTRDLRPATLDRLGVVPAIGALTNQVRDRTGLAVHLEVRGTPFRLPGEGEISLYRIVEEALRNADRHAQATAVTVTLAFGVEYLQASVVDNGRGFPREEPHQLARNGHLGLLGMHERARIAGGELVVTSGADGTRVQITVQRGEPNGHGQQLTEVYALGAADGSSTVLHTDS